ncbi:hypothetical protein GCM10011408_28450 [Dyella caseinilytica]|nr:hypothetical protein GCM10011408_28450 [Dyella caseinilytica]
MLENKAKTEQVVQLRTYVPPLSDDEILAIRQMLNRNAHVMGSCPIATRILEERGL